MQINAYNIEKMSNCLLCLCYFVWTGMGACMSLFIMCLCLYTCISRANICRFFGHDQLLYCLQLL